MLLESVLLLLAERRVFTHDELLEAVECTVHAQQRMLDEHAHARISAAAIGVLKGIGNSLAASDVKPPSGRVEPSARVEG